jgi:hypothetical protein
MNMKNVVELFGGKYLFGGALIQFGEESFKEMCKQIYDAAMLTEREECAKLCEVEADDGTEGEWDDCCLSLAKRIRARTDHEELFGGKE